MRCRLWPAHHSVKTQIMKIHPCCLVCMQADYGTNKPDRDTVQGLEQCERKTVVEESTLVVRMVELLAELRGDPLSSCSLALGMPAVKLHSGHRPSEHRDQCMVCLVGAADMERPSHSSSISHTHHHTTPASTASIEDAGVLCSTWAWMIT